MRLLGFDLSLPWQRKARDLSIDEFIRRLEELHRTASGVVVTPDNCEESPTVQGIVNAISTQIAALPVHVYRASITSDGRESKERLPNHPVARLLERPNSWQSKVEYWLDATSTLVRWGRYFAVKARGVTGPVRELLPVSPSAVEVEVAGDGSSIAGVLVTSTGGRQTRYAPAQLHRVRGRARDFFNGDSPVVRAREAIALEIAAQRFGASFFGNNAMPGLIFSYMDGIKGHMSKEQRDEFLRSVAEAYAGGKRFNAMMLPYGISKPDQLAIENDKAQFLETRKLQRTVIAGAFGIPPHLVGDLDNSSYASNEQQWAEFQAKVVLPYVRMFETALERDLLTDDDRRSGVVIRFNLDAGLRADFKTRQEGLKIQREMGVISANDWREREGMNPLPAGSGGDVIWQQGPSGQNAGAAQQLSSGSATS